MSDERAAKSQLDPEQQQQLLRLALRRQISRASDDDDLAEKIQSRAKILVQALDGNRTQMRNLENIAYSSEKVSDITDYLKQQVGRSDRRERWQYQNVGDEILTDLSDHRAVLQTQVRAIVKHLEQQYPAAVDDDLPRRIHLAMCREYMRHLAANFLYYAVQGEEDG